MRCGRYDQYTDLLPGRATLPMDVDLFELFVNDCRLFRFVVPETVETHFMQVRLPEVLSEPFACTEVCGCSEHWRRRKRRQAPVSRHLQVLAERELHRVSSNGRLVRTRRVQQAVRRVVIHHAVRCVLASCRQTTGHTIPGVSIASSEQGCNEGLAPEPAQGTATCAVPRRTETWCHA